jgi:hypothetical protein
MRYAQLIEEFRRAPYVRLALPFLLGIVWQTQILPLSTVALPITAAILLLYIFLQIKLKSYSLRWIHGIVMLLFLFLIEGKSIRTKENYYKNFFPTEKRICVKKNRGLYILIRTLDYNTTANQNVYILRSSSFSDNDTIKNFIGIDELSI